MLDLYDSIPFPPGYQHQEWLQAGASIVFLAALLACSAMTYHLVEAPMQRLGRRAAARLDARLGNAGNEVQRPHVAVLQGRLDQFLSIEAFSFVQVRPRGSHGHLDAALD
jgi:hypothetical protein